MRGVVGWGVVEGSSDHNFSGLSFPSYKMGVRELPDSIGVWGPRTKITSHGVVSATSRVEIQRELSRLKRGNRGPVSTPDPAYLALS